MEGSFKGFTSSTPSAIRQSPPYGLSNENELNSDESGSKIQIAKKPSKKHFMPPTISAATKASFPRKKILTECSNFNDTHPQKNPNLNSKPSSKRSPSFNCSSQPDYEDQNSSIADSSLKPYDPLTNYLSPRPKFLRYNPNRRREIFLHPKNKIRGLKHEFDGKRSLSFDSQKSFFEDESSISFSQESTVQLGDDKIEQSEANLCNDDDKEEEEEETEEFYAESGCSLKGAFKFLLVMAALVFSTIYISSMNSSMPSSTVEFTRGFGDEYHKIQNSTFEAVGMKILEGRIDQRDENQTGLMEMKMIVEDDMRLRDSSNELENNWEVHDQLQVSQIGENEDLCDDQFEESEEVEGSAHLVGTEAAEKSESFQDYQIEIYSPTILNIEKYIDLNSEDETVEIKHEISSVEEITKEGTEERDDIISSNKVDEIATSGRICNEDEEPDSISLEADSTRVITKQAKIESIPIPIIGVFLFLAALISLAFVYRSRKVGTRGKVERINPVHDVEREKMEKKKGFTSPSSLVCSSVGACKELSCYSHAPMVELIGENSSSISSTVRRSAKKSKMVETEESSSCSFSQEKGPSISYGSFTTEKKIVKKEKKEGKDGEVNMVITTPVRRSSRLHNRAVVSP